LNFENFTYLLANPQKITSEDLAALESTIQKYPYFQSARALQLKGLKNQGSYLYNDALKLTAAHTTDRDILFEYITSEKFIQNEISQTILQHDASVEEIKVVSENVSEQISLEIDMQIKAEMQKAENILNPELFQRKVESVSNLVEKVDDKPDAKDKAEEILQSDKPLEFTKNDTHSFSEWLKLTKAKPIERNEDRPDKKDDETQNEDRERKFELIDKFIQERPKIIPSEIENKPQKEGKNNLAKPYTQAADSLMTETLAKVYLQQKNYKKAIQAYKILILKNPEKSGFFADQIRAIEKLINSEQS
jgi:tetratricopeptide (TPR) repeat protein